jgi:hypothetical protein
MHRIVLEDLNERHWVNFQVMLPCAEQCILHPAMPGVTRNYHPIYGIHFLRWRKALYSLSVTQQVLFPPTLNSIQVFITNTQHTMGRKICSCILNTERLHTNKLYFVPSFLLLHIPSLARLLFLFISFPLCLLHILSSLLTLLLSSFFSSICYNLAFPLSSVSRLVLRPTQPPVQRVSGVLSLGLKGSRGVTPTTHQCRPQDSGGLGQWNFGGPCCKNTCNNLPMIINSTV